MKSGKLSAICGTPMCAVPGKTPPSDQQPGRQLRYSITCRPGRPRLLPDCWFL